MSVEGEEMGQETVQIVCTECMFSRKVEKAEQKPADVIVEHGRETGHTVRIEEPAED